MNCPSCGEKAGREWRYCPYCGYSIPGGSRLKKPRQGLLGDIDKLIKNTGLTSLKDDKKIKINIKTGAGPLISFESGKGVRDSSPEKFLKMPKDSIEPKTEVKQFLNELKIKVSLPKIKKIEDVELTRVGESIEVRAVSKNKGYFKVIHVPEDYTLESKKLNKGVLDLRLRV